VVDALWDMPAMSCSTAGEMAKEVFWTIPAIPCWIVGAKRSEADKDSNIWNVVLRKGANPTDTLWVIPPTP
jgi:hypothetical protein